MTCDEAREYLFAFVDDELTDRRKNLVQEHVAGCAACSSELENERALRRQLGKGLLTGRLATALESLPPLERKVIVMSCALELNYREIAAELHLAHGAVLLCMARSRCLLRERLANSTNTTRANPEALR